MKEHKLIKMIRGMNFRKLLFILLDMLIFIIWLFFILIFLFTNISMQIASLFFLVTLALIIFSFKFTLGFTPSAQFNEKEILMAMDGIEENLEIVTADETINEVEDENKEEEVAIISSEPVVAIEPAVIDSDNPEKAKEEALEYFERANQELKQAQLAVLEHYIQKTNKLKAQVESQKWEIEDLQTQLSRVSDTFNHAENVNSARQQEIDKLLKEKSKLMQENLQYAEKYNQLIHNNQILEEQFKIERQQIERELKAETLQVQQRLTVENQQLTHQLELLTQKNSKLKRAIQQLSEE